MRVLRAILAVAIVAASTPAFAQSTDTVNLQPIVGTFFMYANAIVPVGVILLLGWLGNKYGISALTSNKLLHDALERAIQYGMNAVEQAVDGKPLEVSVANDVLRQALQYAVMYLPKTIDKHGIDLGQVVHLLMGHLPTVNGAITADEINSIVAAAINHASAHDGKRLTSSVAVLPDPHAVKVEVKPAGVA